MTCVLVVGGAGYIGSHMVLALRDAGYKAFVFDDLSRGHADAIGDAPLLIGSLLSLEDISSALRHSAPDAIIHFAAKAYVGESVQNPADYYQSNVVGTLNLLQCMHAASHDKIVFSSSCATYGAASHAKISETASQNPINPYGRTKLIAEWMLEDFSDAYGLKSISLRYFNAAGADPSLRAGERHSPETHLIPLILQAAMRDDLPDQSEVSLKVFGDDFSTPDGTCIRDYVHVSDLCSAHLLALERLLTDQCVGAEAYNLSCQSGHSVLDVIRACERVAGVQIPFEIAPRRTGDPAVLVGDSHHARNVLGWNPQFENLDQIVSTAWRWLNKD